jgi:CBS domain-containing protein
MQVKDIMTRKVETVYADTPLANVAEKMRSHDIGILPVYDGDTLVGTITDRDITVRATANGLHPQMIRSQDVMTRNVVSCFEDQDVDEAGRIMQENKVRRLPVINQHRKLVGILSIGDIALGTGDTKLVGVAIQKVSMPDAPKPLPGQKRE